LFAKTGIGHTDTAVTGQRSAVGPGTVIVAQTRVMPWNRILATIVVATMIVHMKTCYRCNAQLVYGQPLTPTPNSPTNGGVPEARRSSSKSNTQSAIHPQSSINWTLASRRFLKPRKRPSRKRDRPV
jgi:hypothetical protein